MVIFGPFYFFQNSPAQFPCGFDGDLGCFVYLKTSVCKFSRKFWCTLRIYCYDALMTLQSLHIN